MINWLKGIGLVLLLIIGSFLGVFLLMLSAYYFPYIFTILFLLSAFLFAAYCFKNMFDYYDGRKL